MRKIPLYSLLCPLALSSFPSTLSASPEIQPSSIAPAQVNDLTGKLTQNASNSHCLLENSKIRFDISVANRTITSATFTDKRNGRTFSLGPDVFRLGLGDAKDEKSNQYLTAKDFLAQSPNVIAIPADPKGQRLVDQKAGQKITIPFAWNNEGLSLEWWAELREGASYVRIGLDLIAQQSPLAVKEIILLDFAAPEGRVEGTVDGVPVTVDDRLFCGVESPLSDNFIEKGRVICQMKRRMPLPSRHKVGISAVMGVCSHGQLRRTFQQDYINMERARPYGTFLNYNTWYDIGYFTPYSEKEALDVVKKYGEELVKKRGVKIDSFMFDDGWDDPSTLWKFHKNLPNEFRNIKQTADSYGSHPGVWFSPWGGYGEPKNKRMNAAKDSGFETNNSGFALAGPKYYEHFKNECLRMIKENGINHFKFDGTGNAVTTFPGSRFGTDFKAIIALIAELRKARPDIYINLTTGTWASPFWFSIADSIYRGSWDHEFIGEGSQRNKWITFRDAKTYQNNVAKSPLFPINSLMTHGVIFAKHARGLNTDPNNDLPNEIWSGFASGTQMQEIYISPELLNQEQWDELAKAANWARANESTLIDSRWIGGDPAALQPYGWAAWSPKKAILTVRNPSEREQKFTFEPATLWEIPVGSPTKFNLSTPMKAKLPTEKLEVGKTQTLTLQPFEVIVLEATPQN